MNNSPPANYDPTYAVPYIRHETDNQNQILIPVTPSLASAYTCTGGCLSDWVVTIGGSPATISSVVGANGGNNVIVTLSGTAPVIGIGQAVLVSYSGGGAILNNFTNRQSYNARYIDCPDFAFAAYIDNSLACAPVTPNSQMVFSVKYGARNSSRWDITKITGRVFWIADNAAPESRLQGEEVTIGGVSASNTYYIGLSTSDWIAPTAATYTYPAADPVCGYTSYWNVRPDFNAGQGIQTNCARASAAQIQSYASYNNDDTGVGADVLLPATIIDSDLVCVGTNVNMTFSDGTDLNCNPAVAPTPANDSKRWVRVVYGAVDLGGGNTATSNIPNVMVGGVQVTDANGNLLYPGGYSPPNPTFGTADAFGVVEIAAPVNANRGILDLITTSSTAGQVVGQRFWVRLDYWNPCNAYDLAGDVGNLRREVLNEIEIIGKPNPPTVSPAGPFCENDSDATFNFTSAGTGSGTLTYTWYRDAGPATVLQGPATDNTFNVVTEGPIGDRISKAVAASTTFHRYVTVTQSSNGCTSLPADISIQIDDSNTAGAISHPLGAPPISICSGTDPASFTSLSAGTGGGPGGAFTYQWQSSPDGVTYTDIAGATASTYDPPALTTRTFFRRVVRSGQCADAATVAIEFLIDTPVTAGSINTTAAAVCSPGDPGNIPSTALPTGGSSTGVYVYDWEFSTNGGVSWTPIGVNSTSYNPPAGVTTTTMYRRKVTSGVCNTDGPDAGTDPDNVAYTLPRTVEAHQVINPGVIGNAQSICSGGNPALLTNVTSPTGGNGTFAYQWEQSPDGVAWAVATPGPINNLTFDPPALTATTHYRRRTRSPGPGTICAEQYSNVITITVNPLPTVSNVSGGGAVCGGSPAPDIVFTFTGTTNFDFTIDVNPGTDIVVTGHNSTTYTIASPMPGVATSYQVLTLTDGNGCVATTLGGVANVTVGGSPTVFDTAPSLTPSIVCQASPATGTADPQLDFSLTPASTFPGSNYTLNYTVDGGPLSQKNFMVTGGTGNPTAPIAFTEAALNNTGGHTITIVSIVTPATCQSTFNTGLSFTVNPLPSPPTGGVGATVCESVVATASISVANPGAGLTIDWYAAATGGSPLTNGTATLSFIPGAAGTYHAETRNTTTACVSASRLAVTLIADPLPVIPNQIASSICSGTAFTVPLVNNPPTTIIPPGTQYAWTVQSISPTAGSVDASSQGVPQAAIGQTLTNSTNQTQTVTYLVTPSAGTCTGASFNVSVDVAPRPSIPAQNLEICSGDVATLNLVNGVPTPATILPAGTTYSWALPLTSGGVSGATTGTNQPSFTQTLINTTTDVHTANYVLMPTSGSCDGAAFPVQITVNPIPQLSSALAAPDICSGTFAYIPTSATSGAQWTWTRAAVLGIAEAASQSGGYPAPGPGLVNEWLTNTTTSALDVTYVFTTYANGCSRTQNVLVRVNPTPVANPITGPVTVCAGTGNTYFYNVTQRVGSTYSWEIPVEFEVAAAGGGAVPGGGQGPFSVDYFVLLRFNTATVQSIRVYERSADGCVGVVNVLPITVSSGPATVPITGPVSVCGNATGVVYSVPANPTSSFIWSASGGATIIGPSAGPNLNQIAVDFNNLPNATISVTETNISGCPAIYPSLDVTINQTLPGVNSVTPIVVCSGDLISTIVFTSNADPGVTFDWTNDNPAINLGLSGIGNIPGFTSTVNTGSTSMIANISVVGTKSGCSGATMNFTITVNPQPVMVAPPLAPICSRDVTNIAFGTNGVSVIASQYRLNNIEYSSNGGPFSGVAPAGFAPSMTNRPVGSVGPSTHVEDDSFENTSLFPVTVRYTVTPISPGTTFTPAGCEGDPVQVEITVNPEPVLDPSLSPTDICSGESIEDGTPLPFELASAPGSVAATSFILRGVSAGGLTAGPANETIGSGKDKDALDDDSWVNVSNSTRTAVYTIAPVTGSCAGADQSVTVEVNPAPALAPGLDRIVCSGAATGVLLIDNSPTSAPAGSFDILSIVVETGGVDPSIVPGGTTLGLTADAANAAAGTSTSINYIQNDRFTNGTDDRAVVIYTAVPVAPTGMNSCRGQEAQIRVTVEPQIKSVSISSASQICSGSNISITLQSPTYSNGNPTNPLVTFNYSAVPVAGLFGTTVGNAVAEGTVINDNLVNNSTGDINLNYRVTAFAATAANGLGCSGATEDVFVLVRPLPKANNISNKTICSRDNVSLALSSPTYPAVPSNIEFEVTTVFSDAGIAGFPVGGRVVSNPTTITDELVNASSVTGKVTYQIVPRSIPSAGGCINPTPLVVDVTVSPRPVIVPIADFALCSGDTFDPKPIITDTESAPGGAGTTLVSWNVNPAISPVTGESNGSGNSFAQTLFNNTTDKHVVTYSITARNISSSPTCPTDSPITLRVTVYPNPAIASLPSSFDVCNNSALNPNPYVLQSNVVPSLNVRFDWTVDDSGNPDLPDLPSVNGGTAINQTYQNNGEFLGSYQYTISPYLIIPASDNPVIELANGTDNRCSAVMETMTVVNVAPTVGGRIYGFDISGNETDEMFVCAGSSAVVFIEPTGLALMEVTYTEGGVTKTLPNLGGLKQLQVKPVVTTEFELVSVRDAFGCEASINESVTVNVNSVDNTFSIVGTDIACAPFDATFQHHQVAGVSYTWKWLDGPDSTTYLATANEPNKMIKHRFLNPSPSSQARYRVQLDAFLDTAKYIGGCRKPPFVREVRVYPTITAAVFPDEEVICSDEPVSFVNSSQGATIHRWFYRAQGSSEEIDIRTTRVPANYTLPNHTSSNPLIVEVVYQASNAAGCNAPEVVTPITVYRGVTAGFSHTPPSVFVGGASTADFTNNSNPTDGSDFRYDWDFGQNADPQATQGIGPYHVSYSTPGPKEIVLTATNILAEQNGLRCADEHREIMPIIIPPLLAEFVVIPEESCFPTDITVTENHSTGDKFAWRVFDDGGTAASSNAALPVFKIPSPGVYTVELVTTNSFTGDEQRSTKEVTIYDIPTAEFSVRPIIVYVPEGAVNIVNTSQEASGYQWDFGDGTISEEEEPTHSYTAEGVYDITLVALYDHGNDVICYDTVAHQVTAKQGGVSRIPNAFTPNPNGSTSSHGTPGLPGSNSFNDVFLPQVKGAEEFNMQVFDRWGNLIFESNSSTAGWDGYDENGKLMPAGVYVYKLTLRLSDGQRTTQVGDITMIR